MNVKAQALERFINATSNLLDELGPNEAMEELAAAYNGIFHATTDPSPHIVDAMELAGHDVSEKRGKKKLVH